MTGLVLLGGTTASGKSALATALAVALDGVVVNADALQLHVDLSLLTARPSAEDEARVPHRLFGLLGPEAGPSAGWWLRRCAEVLAEIGSAGRFAIVVGGTSLYLKALLRGLAPVPEIDDAVRAEVRDLAARLGPPMLHARLAAEDPTMAARLRPSDPQRVARALEVLRSTGRSLAAWQDDPPERVPLPARVTGLALVPPPPMLEPRIRARLGRMVDAGALDQLAELLPRIRSRDAPVMKALGARELAAHLDGVCDLRDAIEAAVVSTRRYAKRQRTFLRTQLPELELVPATADVAGLERLVAHCTAKLADEM